MDQRVFELLSQVKQRYVEACGEAEFQAAETGSRASARQFYLQRLEDNLVRPMAERHVAEYSQGSGSELDDKMRALRSSSAMTFNLLGNEACAFGGSDSVVPAGTYRIEYEHQLPTLRWGMPANLDALLTGSDGAIIACEMKMLEWLTSAPRPLKAKYFDEGSYLYPDEARTFIKVARTLEASEGFARYDYTQMFKHALALYNTCRARRLQGDTLILLNCVWEPPESYDLSPATRHWVRQAQTEEHAGFAAFREAMGLIEELFQDAGVAFRVEYLTVAQAVKQIRHAEAEQRLLARYC